MFPFSYNTRIIVSLDGEQKIDIHNILMEFKEQFDNPSFKKPNIIAFDNFRFFLKRHQWLSNGVLTINKTDNHVIADLELGFYTAPVMLLLASLGFVVMNSDDLWFALSGVIAFWVFYALLYLWTTTMFQLTIERTIGYQLFLAQTGLDDDQKFVEVKDICPGCGNKLNLNEIECPECGLCFIAE